MISREIGEMLKWGEIYYMFKKCDFSTKFKDPDELQVFKNIMKSSIFRVVAHPTILPCAYDISWIMKNTNLNNVHVYNSRKEPIASSRSENLAKCFHIEEGIKRLDSILLNKFEYTPNEFFPKWYREDKKFKYRPKSGYPNSALRIPYQYLVAMSCRLYGEFDTTQFSLSYIPIIYYCMDEGTSFNWDEILYDNLTTTISSMKQAQPRNFPSFHMSSYLLDIMCMD
jgi:hypothetical protein